MENKKKKGSVPWSTKPLLRIAGAGFERRALGFCFLLYFVLAQIFVLSGCGAKKCMLHPQGVQHIFYRCPWSFSLHLPQAAVKTSASYSPVVGLLNPKAVGSPHPRQKNKSKSKDLDYFYCGSRIWTNDLRVMSPTSYQSAPSRDISNQLK